MAPRLLSQDAEQNMPAGYDKHGPPQLWATVTCLVPGCGGRKLIWPDQAEAIARKLERGYGLRYLIGRFRCAKCRYHNASIAFHLAYAGKRPWDKPAVPWTNEGERAAWARQQG